jgi:hypothetical protein
MSHTGVVATRPTAHSAGLNNAALAQPLLVVENLDHTTGSTTLFAYGVETAAADTVQFTFCVQSGLAETFGVGNAASLALQSDMTAGTSWI